MAKERSNIVPCVPTPTATNYEEKFNKYFYDLLNLLKSIDFEQYRVSNWIELNDDTLLIIEDYIIELSKPEYKAYLEKIIIPNRPSKKSIDDESIYQKQLKEADLNIRCLHYIRELIYIYSIYHNHQNRNYFLALCSHISSAYSRRYPDQEIYVVFRFKSPKGLILKLAKNIFFNGYFHRDPSNNTDTFKYKTLNDVFGFKIIAKSGFSPSSSQFEDIQSLIDNRNHLSEKIHNFDLFLEALNTSPTSVTNYAYLNNCRLVLSAIQSDTIHNEEEKLIQYLQSKINEINGVLSNLGAADSLNSPLDANYTREFKFKNWLAKYKKRIDAPLTLKGLKCGIKTILEPPQNIPLDDENFIEYITTKYFNIFVSQIEEKHTSSGHEGLHCDIQTPLGMIELQLQTDNQHQSDQFGEMNSHGLMKNKEIPAIPLPKTYTLYQINSSNYEIVDSKGTHFIYKKDSLYEAKDSNNNYFYFIKDEVDHYIRLVELYTAKKGDITYNPREDVSTVRLFPSLKNYQSISFELPENHPKRKDFEKYFSILNDKSKAVLEIFFHRSGSDYTDWNTEKISQFISQYQNTSNKYR